MGWLEVVVFLVFAACFIPILYPCFKFIIEELRRRGGRDG